MLLKAYAIGVAFMLIANSITAQAKWPIPIYFEKYGIYCHLTNDVNLNDTAKISYSANTFFRLVLFDAHGKSYFEAYRNNKIYEKGYFANSLDTLKKYSHAVNSHKRDVGGYRVLKYFHPLKSGVWYERIKGRVITKKYNMGIEEK